MLLLPGLSLAFGSHPDVIAASRHDISPSLSQLLAAATPIQGAASVQKASARRTRASFTSTKTDSVAVSVVGPLTGVATLSNFDGQSAQDNRDLFGFAFLPPGVPSRGREGAGSLQIDRPWIRTEYGVQNSRTRPFFDCQDVTGVSGGNNPLGLGV